MEKSYLRKEIKNRLENLSSQEKSIADRKIIQYVLGLSKFCNADSVFVFLNTSNEPNTSDIISYLLKNGKKVFAPKLVGDRMIIAEYREDTPLALNKFGIKEPILANLSQNFDVDVSIVPLVGFDERLNRLGHGKAYYDRFFAMSNSFKIGISYECQKVEQIPTESHDVKLDIVVTERGIYK